MEQNAEKLVAEFFAGKVYFTFESKDELNSFSAFIKLYGPYADLQLYMPTFLKRGETKSAAWGHLPGALFPQVLAMDDVDHFQKYFGECPVKYSDVRVYIEQETKLKEAEKSELEKEKGIEE